MLNQTVIVGRMTADAQLIEEGGKKKTCITIAVPRSFKNINGEYDIDFINCVLWSGVAENTVEYIKKGDLVGIKGRLQALSGEPLVLVAEKVTFLSSKNKEEENQE